MSKMMKSFVRTVGVACLACVLGLANEAQGAATISLKAVAKNGAPIAATNTLSVARNDTITAEIYLFGWGTPPFDAPTNSGLIQTYNVTVLGEAGAISNGRDGTVNAELILPNGWVAPLTKDTCPCDNPAYPTCDPLYGCVGAGHTPANMGSINATRSDYIFFGLPNFPGVDVSTIDVRYGSTINGPDGQAAGRCVGGTNIGGPCLTAGECPGSTCNTNFLHYAGTLNLKVGASACGTYTFNISGDASMTFIANTEAFPIQVVPAREALTLTVTGFACSVPPSGACCDTTNPSAPTCSVVAATACVGATKRYGGDNSTCANINPPCAFTNTIVSETPIHCTIDARRPFPPNTPATRQGFNSMTLVFQNARGTGEDAAADFQVTQVPSTTPPVPPTISSVTAVNATTITLNFSAPVQPNKWTCVRHIASATRRCIGYLPADADSNRTAGPVDILAIIDNLNGIRQPPLLIHQCDIDRSNVCAAADIIAEIDLLNGTNGYPVQNGKTLEVCPSTAAP
jgi:hypothetical protein